MSIKTRRQFIATALGGSAALAAAGLITRRGQADPTVIIGAGPAGVQAALGYRIAHPERSVVLLERDPSRLSRVADGGGAFARPSAPVDLATLQDAGVEVVLDDVIGVDWSAQRLAFFSGRSLAFEDVVLAPGVAPRSEGLSGYDAHARHVWPAAWGSVREAQRLGAQLAALPEDGHVVLRLPRDAGGYPKIAALRALALANALHRSQPAARLTVLDAAPDSAARTHFAASYTPPNVTWLGPQTGGTVTAVDARQGWIETNAGRLHADVVNFVVPQRAAPVARLAGLTDASGWCPVDAEGRSRLNPQAWVIGDARATQSGRSMKSAMASAKAIGSLI